MSVVKIYELGFFWDCDLRCDLFSLCRNYFFYEPNFKLVGKGSSKYKIVN